MSMKIINNYNNYTASYDNHAKKADSTDSRNEADGAKTSTMEPRTSTSGINIRLSEQYSMMCYENSASGIRDRVKHTVVKPGITPLFDTISDTLKAVREKGNYDYSDIADVSGYAYVKCYSEIEKKYENSHDKYYNPDGSPCTKEQEIEWLNEAYEEKINWEKATVRIAAEREQFLGNIPDIPQTDLEKDIEEYGETIKQAKEQYLKKYQEEGVVELQHFPFGQSSLLQKLSERIL